MSPRRPFQLAEWALEDEVGGGFLARHGVGVMVADHFPALSAQGIQDGFDLGDVLDLLAPDLRVLRVGVGCAEVLIFPAHYEMPRCSCARTIAAVRRNAPLPSMTGMDLLVIRSSGV